MAVQKPDFLNGGKVQKPNFLGDNHVPQTQPTVATPAINPPAPVNSSTFSMPQGQLEHRQNLLAEAEAEQNRLAEQAAVLSGTAEWDRINAQIQANRANVEQLQNSIAVSNRNAQANEAAKQEEEYAARKESPNAKYFVEQGKNSSDNVVESSRANWAQIAYNEAQGIRSNQRSIYRYMTDDQVATYNYVLGKDGKEAANAYLLSIEDVLAQKEGAAQAEHIENIGGVGEIIAKGVYGVAAGSSNALEGMRQNLYKEALPTTSLQYGSQAIRENLSGVGALVYDVAGQVGNMLPSIVLSVATGGIGKAVASAYTGLSAKGNAYNQALKEGYSQDQAANYSTLIGASEGVLQYLLSGIAKVGGIADDVLLAKVKGIDNAFARLVLTGAIKVGGEVTEEELQLIIEPTLRSLILNEEYNAPTWNEVAYTALLSALSVGALEGAPKAAGKLGNVGFDLLNKTVNNIKNKRTANPLASATGNTSQATTDTTETNGAQNAKKPYVGTMPQNVSAPRIKSIETTAAPYLAEGETIETAWGNKFRDIVRDNAKTRLDIKENQPAYLVASNITKDGETYYAKITPSSLNKMLFTNKSTPLEISRILVVDNIEKIFDDAVWAYSEGDRKGRQQVNGFDTLRSSFYIDGVPYYVDIKVKVLQQTQADAEENIAYFLEPESIEQIKKAPASPRTGWRQAPNINFGGDTNAILDDSVAPPAEIVNKNDGLGAANRGTLNSAYEELQLQRSQFHPEGANAARPVDVPTTDFEGRNISRFPSNAMGAKALSDDTVEAIEILTAEGILSDDVQSNTETMQKAETEINKIGKDGAMERLRNAAFNGETSPEIIGMMEAMLVDAEARGDKSRVAELVYLGSKLSRNSGRALQMLSYLRKMSPEYQLQVIDQIVDNINNDIDSKRSKRSKEKNGESNIQIPEELRQKYLNAQNAQERSAVVGEMQQYVADHMKSTWLEKWTAIRYTNMLGNLKTPIRNIIGNVGMRFLAEGNNAIVSVIERAVGGKLGSTRSVMVSKSLIDAAKADYDVHKDAIVGQARYSDSFASSDSFMQGVQDKRKILPPILEQYRKGTQWIMDNQYFGDTAFMKSAYSRFLGGYLKANGVTAAQFTDPAWQATHGKLIEDARTFATQQARETTFRDNNALSDWVSKIGRRKDTPWYARMAAEGFSPFRKTPANVLVRAEEYSPLGLVNATVQAVQKARGAEITGNDIVTALSKSVTGSVLFGLGMLLLNSGWLRTKEDDEDQAAFDDLVGAQDYSLVLPDGTNLTIDWLTPASIPLFMGAKLAEILQKEDLSFRDIESIITSIAEPMLQMSMLSGVSDTLDDIKFSENNTIQLVASTALGYLTQGLTNTLLGQLERATQYTRKSTYTDAESPVPDWLQRELGSASAKTPVWDYNQIDYIDAWGRTEDSISNDFLRLAYETLSPAYVSRVDIDDVEAELQRVYDKTGSGGVFPDRAERSISVNGETKNLTAEQYVRYAKSKGQKSYQYAKEAIASSAYKSMSPADQADYISKMYSYANYKASKEIFSAYSGSEEMQKFAEAEKQGISPAEWYTVRNNINDLDADKDKNGKTISGSRQEKVEDYISEQNLTDAQKDWLYIWQYKSTDEKDLKKLPWNKD